MKNETETVQLRLMVELGRAILKREALWNSGLAEAIENAEKLLEEGMKYPFIHGFERRPVTTKHDFVIRYAQGEFGNAGPTWGTYHEYETVNRGRNVNTLFHIRNRIAGGTTWYNIPLHRMQEMWNKAQDTVSPKDLYISEMAPTELTVIQGEVQRRAPNQLEFYYTQVAKPMRDALATDARQSYGVLALDLLRIHLDYNSFEWLENLLNWYPDHVIEFSTYAKEWGTVPGYNTVFWEVRKY